MAFNTTTKETYPKKGVWKAVDTLADTAGVATAHQLPDAVSIAIQATVTGTPGTITIKASNDGVTYFALPVTTITFTASGIKSVAVADLGYYNYRAELSGGDATTSWTLTWISKIRQAGTP